LVSIFAPQRVHRVAEATFSSEHRVQRLMGELARA
jgi:hypothetical protein